MKIKYFGKIAELISLAEENWSTSDLTIAHFKNELLQKYPIIAGETIRIAVNLKIENADYVLSQGDEIAILPPFSGG